MQLGIVILNYNNYRDTINCLDSILANSSVDKIVIVDNNSSDNSVEKIRNFIESNKNSQFDKFRFIINNKNLGYAKGNNIGLKYLVSKKIKYIAVINSDILIRNNIFKKLCNKLSVDSSIGFISPLIFNTNNSIDYTCMRYDSGIFNLIYKTFFNSNSNINFKDDEIKCDILSGAFLMASSNTWVEIDFFDENTFLYFEENILYEKLKFLRKKSIVLTDVFVIHLGGKSTSKVSSEIILEHQMNSLIYYLKKYKKINILCEFAIKLLFATRIKLISLKNCV